ncbi:MAG: F0F1 ATP synthase subunit epsilon [Flavobacteriales bacterium]
MILDILTPESLVFHGKVEAVKMPGIEGEFQVLNGHAAIISALKSGTVIIDLAQATQEMTEKLTPTSDPKKFSFAIKGGVAEMLGDQIVLLAD